MYLMSSIYRASLVHKELVIRERQETKPVFVGLLVTQHPPVHHPKMPFRDFMDGMETVPQGSVYLVSSLFFSRAFFFLMLFFSSLSLFFLPGFPFDFIFLCPAILEPNFFSGNSYLLLQPTSLPPPNPSTSPYLPHHPFSLPSMARASEPP